MQTTAERLRGYCQFSDGVVETVADFADIQRTFPTYHDFFDYAGVSDPKTYQPDGGSYAPVQILDMRPSEHDPDKALVVQLPMANPLDANNIYQVATVAATNPTLRVIAAANPSGPGYNSGKLNNMQREKVASGNFRPAVEPVLKYIESQNITQVQHAGYSYGADKVVAAATHGDFNSLGKVLIEPASAVKRSVLELGRAFLSTNEAMEDYVAANGLETFIAARKDSVGLASYTAGILRKTNMAVAKGIASGTFEKNLYTMMLFANNNESQTTIAWGSNSELVDDDQMGKLVSDNRTKWGTKSFSGIRLERQRHALANDIHLLAALVLECLKAAR